jgi:SSS family solute:Na+ symporter
MLMAFLLFVLCVAIMVVTTFLFPEPFPAGAKLLVWENWREPLSDRIGGRGLGNYRVLAVFILAVFIALYFVFR